MPESKFSSTGNVLVIGSGLIGTSVALGLTAQGRKVFLSDINESALADAVRVSGAQAFRSEVITLVIVATPPAKVAQVIHQAALDHPDAVITDVASVKVAIFDELIELGTTAWDRIVGGHPMAGREVGGAASARADLFEGRTWIYCPTFADGAQVDSDVLEAGLWLINSLGATPISMSASRHDSAVALVSHLPQIVASLLAAQLKGAKSEDLDLAGAGLRDTTRIAASVPELWQEIISSNAQEILPLLINLQNDLGSLIQSLDDPVKVGSFIAAGNEGRSKIPGKHGGMAREYTQLPVVIEDKPGQLAALFDECAKASVNVEDLTIEHSPGQFTGLITLALSASDAAILQKHLEESGWNVHAPR